MNFDYINYFTNEILSKINDETITVDGNFFNFTNIYGYTPLHLLIESLRIENSNSDNVNNAIKLLIENTDLNIQNIYGDSIIHQLLKKIYLFNLLII